MDEGSRAARSWPPVPRTLVMVGLVLALLVIHFTLLRACLMLRNSQSAADTSAGDLFWSFVAGLRFDAATASYLLAPFLLLGLAPRIGLADSRLHRRIFLVIFTLLVSVLTLVLLAEFEFFREFQTRYNQLALQYLDQPDTVGGMVWETYPVAGYAVLWFLLSALFAAGLWWSLRISFPGRAEDAGRRRRAYLELAAILPIAAGLVICMRGGLQHEPLRWGDAYLTDDEFANQMGLNGLFTLAVSASDMRNHEERAQAWRHSLPADAARELTRRMLVESDERLVDPESRTLLRFSEEIDNSVALRRGERPPNIVLVLMESFSARYMGALGAPEDYAPEMNRLAADGILFSRAFSSGTHTHQGVFSSIMGFPNLPGYEYLMQLMVANQSFSTLPAILRQNGYQTMFLYNGRLEWDNMEGFFRKQGVERFVGVNDFDETTHKDQVWGVRDHDLLRRADREFQAMNEKGPFFAVILTLSNHVPYDLPDPLPFEAAAGHGELDARLDAYRYADWSIGRFIDDAKKQDYFDNTLFVFVGDHGFHIAPKLSESHLLYHHVPLIFYAPQLLTRHGVVDDTVASQMNIAPTVLGLAGVKTPAAFWGRNLFSADPAPGENLAVFKGSGGDRAVAAVRGDRLLVIGSDKKVRLWRYDLGFPASLTPLEGAEHSAEAAEMERDLRAYVQCAIDDLVGHKAGPLPERAR